MQPSNHKILITGGSKGIGLALARKFHAAGNDIVIVGRDQGALDAVSQELSGVKTIQADITTREGIDAVVQGSAGTTVLVNNAGIQLIREFSGLSLDEIELEVRTNFLAPLQLTRRMLPALLEHHESAIINITSVLGIVPKESASVYCATKAALRSFTRSLRWQLEGTPVRVFEAVPPVVDTGMTAGRGTGKMLPEDVADDVWKAYLSDDAEVYVGKAKAAAFLARFVPVLAERIIRRS